MAESSPNHGEHRPTDPTGQPDVSSNEISQEARFARLLSRTRFVILFGAVASLLASIVLLIQSMLAVIEISWDALADGEVGDGAVEHLAVEFLGLIDSILLGTVLYIIALGLYELFFEPDLPVPEWLRFRELSQLKESLVEVIVVLLGVLFVGRAFSYTEGDEIIQYGLSTAAVIVALALLLLIGHIRRRDGPES